MEMLNRLKTTVSNAMPGNPVTREYEMGKQVGSAGPGLMWKIYAATKRSTKQDAAVWLLEKRLLDQFHKADREPLLSQLKRGVAQLTRLRHPKILSVMHPLEESRESLGFVTEPVFASMANVLGYHDQLNETLVEQLKDFKLYDTEIKYGALQLGESLSFLHTDCKQLHNNLCPESIIVIKSGAWKLAGFDFSQSGSQSGASTGTGITGGGSAVDLELQVTLPEWQTSFTPVGQPNLNYLSPEAALQGRASPASDIYSLGMLMFAIYNEGRCLFDARNDAQAYKKNVNQLRQMRVSMLQSLPDNVREYVKLMLNYEPTVRPDADQFTKIPFFEDPGVVVLLNLDNLYQLDNLGKSQFYKNLPRTLTTLPKRINLHRVYPLMAEEFHNANMVPFVLPSVLQIADIVTDIEFKDHVLPKLIPVFSFTEPFHITLIFLQNLNILLTKCPRNEFKSYILPMLNRALEIDNPQVQDLCLNTIHKVAHMMEFSTLKNAVIPRIRKLCHATGSVKIRVNCLMCIGKLMEHMDRWYVLEDVLPLVMEIKSRDAAVLMAILGIFRVAFSHKKLGMTKEFMASRAVPYLTPLSVDSNLNLNQFHAFLHLIKDIMAKIESEHRVKLEQIHSLQKEHKSLGYNKSEPLYIENGQVDASSMMDRFLSAVNMEDNSSTTNGTAGDLLALTYTGPMDTGSSDPSSLLNTKPSNLTIEDKQRLAAQQEQMAMYKNQTPGGSSTLTPLGSTMPPQTNNKPKDLTASLMERNLNSMSTGLTGSKPNYNINAQTGVPPQQPMGFNQPVAPLSIGWGAPPMQAQSPVSGPGFGMMGGAPRPMQPQQQSGANMASLDNLFGGAPTKPSLNQMRGPPMSMGGSMSMQQGGFVPPMGMGMPRPMGMGPMMQPQTLNQNNMQNKPLPNSLSSSDINDLLG